MILPKYTNGSSHNVTTHMTWLAMPCTIVVADLGLHLARLSGPSVPLTGASCSSLDEIQITEDDQYKGGGPGWDAQNGIYRSIGKLCRRHCFTASVFTGDVI